MITFDKLKQKAANKYKTYLKSIITGDSLFPMVIRADKKVSDDFKARPAETGILISQSKEVIGHGYVLEYKTKNEKAHGVQTRIDSFSFATADDFVLFLQKEAEVAQFKALIQQLLSWHPEIKEWLLQNITILLKPFVDWQNICNTTDHLLLHDVSNHYIRNLPIPIDTKLIEIEETLIVSLLKHFDKKLAEQPEKRLEKLLPFRQKAFLFPCRWLDKDLMLHYTPDMPEVGLSAFTLSRVKWTVTEIWLVENETALYMLPERKNAFAICTEGLALCTLTDIAFLQENAIYYWGDMDENGYWMLDWCRKNYPHTISICMDNHCLSHHLHKNKWSSAEYQNKKYSFLTVGELAAYQLLSDSKKRVEQEKLDPSYVQKAINSIEHSL